MFEITTKSTFEEYRKFSITAAKVINKTDIRFFISLVIVAAFAVVLVCVGMYWFLAFWVIFWGAYYPFLFLRRDKRIRRSWESNKSFYDKEIIYRFDEEGFEQISDISSFRAKYSDIHTLIETQTDFYIMYSVNSGCYIGKASLTHEQCLFIREKCGINGIAKA